MRQKIWETVCVPSNVIENEVTDSIEEWAKDHAQQPNVVDCLEVDYSHYFGLSWLVFGSGEEVMSVFLAFENFYVVEHEWQTIYCQHILLDEARRQENKSMEQVLIRQVVAHVLSQVDGLNYALV